MWRRSKFREYIAQKLIENYGNLKGSTHRVKRLNASQWLKSATWKYFTKKTHKFILDVEHVFLLANNRKT